MRVSSVSVEAFRHRSVKGELLPKRVKGLSLGAEALRTIMHKVPIIVSDPDAEVDTTDSIAESLGLEPSPYKLFRPSVIHRRSFVFEDPEFRQTWHDEHGNEYSAISLKGNNFATPGMHEHPTAAEGVDAHGLQESSHLERVLKASEFMRSRGIATEYVFGVTEPKQFLWPGNGDEQPEMLSLDEYKRRIVFDHWTKLPKEEQTNEKLAGLIKQFKDLTFVVSLRAIDSPYRLEEVKYPTARESIYQYANDFLLDNEDQPFDVSNSKDGLRYTATIVAPRLGRNMARFHHAGLYHGYLHAGNVSSLGAVVDLDSVTGEALGIGDKKVDAIDTSFDLMRLTSDMTRRQIDMENIEDMAMFRESLRPAEKFFDSYISEIETLTSVDEARQFLSEVIYKYSLYVPEIEDIDATDLESVLGSMIKELLSEYSITMYAERYFNIDATQQSELFLESAESKLGKIPEIISLDLTKRRILESIEANKQKIFATLSQYFDSDDPSGLKFDFASCLINSEYVLYEANKSINKSVLQTYKKALIDEFMLSNSTESSGIPNEQIILKEFYKNLYKSIESSLYDYIKPLLAEKITLEMKDEINDIVRQVNGEVIEAPLAN